MLIHEESQEDGSISCLFDSTNILAAKYVPNLKKLSIIFSNNRQYVYNNVDSDDFYLFKTTQSTGKAFNLFVKNKYKTDEGYIITETTQLKSVIQNIKQQKNNYNNGEQH